jgi:predicted membrane protein (TIGR00267 family)
MKNMPIEHNPDYIHHTDSGNAADVRELVFGMEDGMTSTLGAITGIATATGDHFTVVLAGAVVISVESIAMAVGSYLSSKSEREIDEHKLREERTEIQKFPQEETEEMQEMYVKDGWPAELAATMASTAAKNEDLLLKEMAYRELHINPDNLENPGRNGVIMFFSYVVGGAVPIAPYFFLPVSSALPTSIAITLVGLFSLGAFTARFSKRAWWKSGLEMLALASAAAGVGYVVGQIVSTFWPGRL